MSQEKQSEYPCQQWKPDLEQSGNDFGQTMVGEFSAATNDCAKYLNGIGVGRRYDGTFKQGEPPVCPNCTCNGTEDWQTWTDDYKQFLRQFIERQMDAFESNIGWYFWNFKTENHANPHWDYLLGVVRKTFNNQSQYDTVCLHSNVFFPGARLDPVRRGQKKFLLRRNYQPWK
jgi:glucan 1,3-beta-glucosidase